MWCQTTLPTILIGSSTAQMTHNFLFSYFDFSSFSLHCSVHSSASIVDRQLLQVPMALASILIEHCFCSLHPFYQPVSSTSVALFHVFGIARIVCLSSGISLGIYPYWANLGRHEISNLWHSSTQSSLPRCWNWATRCPELLGAVASPLCIHVSQVQGIVDAVRCNCT